MTNTAHWRNDVANANGAARTHVVIVAVTGYDEGLESHGAFAATSVALVEFWKNVASGEAPFSVAAYPIETISEIVAHQLNGATNISVLAAIANVVGQIRKKDRLIFHWIGHGFSYGGDHLLALPQHLSPGDPNSRDGFSLSLLTTWIGLNCKAESQFFFVDCCSERLPAGLHFALDRPGLSADSDRQPASRRDQYILMGSGVNRPAFSPANGTSFFAAALITTLNELPRSASGKHVTCIMLRDAIAACIQNSMVQAAAEGLPNRAALADPARWVFGFVQEIPPSRPEFREHQALYLGETSKPPGTECFVWYHDVRGLSGPSLANDGGSELVETLYVRGSYSRAPLRAMLGRISRSDRITISLQSNSVVVTSREWHDEGPVIRYELIEEAVDG